MAGLIGVLVGCAGALVALFPEKSAIEYYGLPRVTQPLPEALEIAGAASGEPALPRKFHWRGETIEIAEVTRKWKSTGPCTHKSGENYVRKHWYEIITVDGRCLKIYFDRQARSRQQMKKRWWAYSELE